MQNQSHEPSENAWTIASTHQQTCEPKLPTTSDKSSFISVFFRRKRKLEKTVTLVDRRKVDGATERIKTIRNTRQRKLVFYRDLIQFPENDRYTW